MGAVYKATDRQLGRDVAIKVVHQHLLAEPGMRERFRREVDTLAGLCHPNVVRLYDYEELADGNVFYTMELIDGETLEKRLEDRQLSIDKATECMEQVASAIAAVHSVGILHRDIKAANILITRHGMAKVSDFGLAAGAHSGVFEPLTKTGQVVGTAIYIAPEVMLGEKATELSDVYQLGLLLYETLAGHCPINMLMLHTFMNKDLSVEMPRVSKERKGIDAGLDEIVRRAMAFDKEQRFQSAAELASALHQWRIKYLASQSAVVKSTPKLKVQRRRWLPAVLCTMVFFLLLAYGWDKPQETFAFKDLRVKTKSAHSCLLEWSSTIEPKAISVEVNEEGGKAVEAGFIAEEINKKRGLITIRGLRSETTYFVVLRSNEYSSVKKRFRTELFRPTRYRRELSLPRADSALIKIGNVNPFRFYRKETKSRLFQYREEHDLVVKLAQLAKQPLFFVDVNDLDGQVKKLTIDSQALLERTFAHSKRAFLGGAKKEAFYRLFARGRGRLNGIMMPVRNKVDHSAFYAKMWQDIEMRLENKAQWYEVIKANMPGLKRAIEVGLVNERIGLTVSSALTPLAMINGCAIWSNVPINEKWQEIVDELVKQRVFVSLTSNLRQRDKMIKLQPKKGPSLPIYMFNDWGHPRIKGIGKLRLEKFTAEKEFDFIVPKRTFTHSEIIELKINVRAPMCPTLLLFNINKGRSKFTVAIPGEHWRSYRKTRDMTADYKDYILLGLRYINCATEGDLKEIARDVIEILPKEDFNVFLRLPKEVLHHGQNSLTIDVLNGPIDDMVGLVVEAPRLQIGI